MRIVKYLIVIGVVVGGIHAAHADCVFTAQREGAADLAGVTKVVINTGAGDLDIEASADAKRIAARGNACASSQALLDNLLLEVRREGDVVHVDAGARSSDKVITIGNSYAHIHVGIALPANLPVEVRDSSGDTVVRGVASLKLDDSSGDIEVSNAGDVAINDSSGDTKVRDVASAEIKDSSGDISVAGVRGDVTVTFDGSGDIEIGKVDGKVEIGSDGSGEIRVTDVKGSVLVGSDGSGDITVENVGGDFTVGNDGDGEIHSRGIAGKVNVP